MPKPKLPATRTDWTVLAIAMPKWKSVVSRPRPLSLLGVGQPRREANRHRGTTRALGEEAHLGADGEVLDSQWWCRPVELEHAERAARSRSNDVIVRRLRKPPSTWTSAMELTPKLTPNVPMRQRLPRRPETREVDVAQVVEAGLRSGCGPPGTVSGSSVTSGRDCGAGATARRPGPAEPWRATHEQTRSHSLHARRSLALKTVGGCRAGSSPGRR